VRGTRFQLIDGIQYPFKNAIYIINDVCIPKSQHQITCRFQARGSICITHSLLIMLAAVDFQNEFGFRAKEVRNEAIDRDLSLELPSGESAIA
jgi:hypothetical protein